MNVFVLSKAEYEEHLEQQWGMEGEYPHEWFSEELIDVGVIGVFREKEGCIKRIESELSFELDVESQLEKDEENENRSSLFIDGIKYIIDVMEIEE